MSGRTEFQEANRSSVGRYLKCVRVSSVPGLAKRGMSAVRSPVAGYVGRCRASNRRIWQIS
jgi:hypothetical protein